MIDIMVAPPPLLHLYDPTQAYPPFLEQILADLRAKKPIIFAWGDRLYNPQGALIPPELMAHEQVHCERQLSAGLGIESWWRSYIENPCFRLEEELPAHRAEFAKLCERHRDRNQRAVALHRLALRLSSALYGSLIDYATAKDAIAGNSHPEKMPGFRQAADAVPRGRFRARVEDAHS